MYVAWDGIVFDVLLLNGWDTNAIMSDDGVDFLYWHHLIDVIAILNPGIVAADIFPPLIHSKLNSKIKAKKEAEDVKWKPRTDLGFMNQFAERPNKSPIFVPPLLSPSIVPNPTGTDTLFYDAVGEISQKAAPGTPSYPPSDFIGPGLPFSTDLAAKTGPVGEPLGGNWNDPVGGVAAAPGTLEETHNQYSLNPTSLLGPILEVAENLQGAPRPPAPQNEPGPARAQAPPPARGQRVRFPANANLPATDIELRDRLQVPRRKLQIWINSGPDGAPEFILNLPYDGCLCDAKHGPTCVDMNMSAIHGNVTGVKRLVFECFEALPLFYGVEKDTNRLKGGSKIKREPGGQLINQHAVQPNKLLTPPLISNRWEMKQVPDPTTHLNTTVISGKAVFRMDVLSRMQITADQLRPYIMPPIPMGYKRRPPEVSLSGGGNEVVYMIVDDQQMMNNPSGYRWGVHSVVLLDSVSANNPMDVYGPVFRAQR